MIEFRTRDRPNGQDTRQAYDDIYVSRPIELLDSFYLYVLGLLRPAAGRSLLDVSCGTGRLLLLARGTGVRPVGLDFAEPALRRARRTLPGGNFALGNAEQLPFADASFDYITNLGSIEHYEEPARAVAEMARVLKPSGVAIILLPNAFSLLHVLYVWRTGDIFDDGQPLQRYATRTRWRRLLEDNGLVVAKVFRYQREPPSTLSDLLWYARRPGKILQLLLTPLIPLDAINCFVFECSRA